MTSDVLRLEAIVRDTPWLMSALQAVRDVDPPDWLLGAGAVRNAVWDRLHGYTAPTPLSDVDVAFFDPADLSPERDRGMEAALSARAPTVRWDAKNQAAVHLWYPERFGVEVKALTSSADGVWTSPETATAVALRLELSGRLLVVAPCGLGDLLGLVHRRNPRRVTRSEYLRRMAAKRIAQRWPRVTVVE